MSGYPGLNDWEKYYEANRRHIEGMMDRFAGRSRQVRRMSNAEIAKSLYQVILSGEIDELVVSEAAERLGATKTVETTTMEKARRN